MRQSPGGGVLLAAGKAIARAIYFHSSGLWPFLEVEARNWGSGVGVEVLESEFRFYPVNLSMPLGEA